jgi:hypothetical protein
MFVNAKNPMISRSIIRLLEYQLCSSSVLLRPFVLPPKFAGSKFRAGQGSKFSKFDPIQSIGQDGGVGDPIPSSVL